jgi:Flp pilus assembly protein CpaB
VAVLAFVLNLLALRDRDATVMVAVAARPLAVGAVLTADALRMVPVAADFEGLSSLVAEAQLATMEGWVLGRSVPPGGLIERTMLVEPGASSGLRSMSVPVAAEHANGGSIAAGDRVDVISVVDGAASYVAVGLEVLAISERQGGSLGGLGSSYIVVAVDEGQALRLAEAIDAGSIEVVRSTGAAEIDRGSGGDGS